LPAATSPSDAELIARARRGDARAHLQLRTRHADAAQRLAEGLGRAVPAGDGLVDDAFAALGREIERGRGPDVGYRTALFTTVVRIAGAGADAPTRSGSRLAHAYASLPEPWQAVLWCADVERLASAEIETYLGLSATDLSALDYRARSRLRQAYLTQARQTKPSDACGPALDRIEAHLLGALSGGERAKVERHLNGCITCRDIAADLGDLRAALVTAVAPAVLGPAGAAYLADRSVIGDESTGSTGRTPPARHGRSRRYRRNRTRASAGLALVTVLVVGLLTWIVYGASTAGVSGAEVAAEAERRGELGPAAPAAESEGPTTGTADDGATTGTPAGTSDADGPAPGAGTPAGSATPGTATESTAAAPATGAPPATPAPSSSTPPAASPPATSTAPPAPAPSAPPATAPAVINPPAIVAVPPPPTPTADLSLAIAGAHHGSATVTVVVRNAGPQAAAAPTVEFVLRRLPRGVPAGCSPNPTRLTMACSVGTLGANRQVQLGVAVVDGIDVVGVRVLSSTADPNQADNLWTILPGSISLDRPLSGVI
jgi:DNA-directed RNA polymerase specialized sigma24 family protein